MNTASGRDGDDNRPVASQQSRVITVTDERINSRDLFSAGRQITIEHGGEIYTLRLTAQNKLILTK